MFLPAVYLSPDPAVGGTGGDAGAGGTTGAPVQNTAQPVDQGQQISGTPGATPQATPQVVPDNLLPLDMYNRQVEFEKAGGIKDRMSIAEMSQHLRGLRKSNYEMNQELQATRNEAARMRQMIEAQYQQPPATMPNEFALPDQQQYDPLIAELAEVKAKQAMFEKWQADQAQQAQRAQQEQMSNQFQNYTDAVLRTDFAQDYERFKGEPVIMRHIIGGTALMAANLMSSPETAYEYQGNPTKALKDSLGVIVKSYRNFTTGQVAQSLQQTQKALQDNRVAAVQGGGGAAPVPTLPGKPDPNDFRGTRQFNEKQLAKYWLGQG